MADVDDNGNDAVVTAAAACEEQLDETGLPLSSNERGAGANNENADGNRSVAATNEATASIIPYSPLELPIPWP